MSRSLPIFKSPVRLSLELLLIVAIAIGIFLRIIYLGSREFWYDEVLSLLLSTGQKAAYQSPNDSPVVLADYTPLLSLPRELGARSALTTVKNLLLGLLGGEPHPPLFFLSQHLWLHLFGNSEVAMRSLNTLLSVGAIGSAYGLGQVLLGHRAGLLLAGLLATNPFYLFHSLNVRMYEPLVLWTTLSAWALLHLIYQRDTQAAKSHRTQFLWNALLIGSVAAGLLTFYLFTYWVITLAALVLYLDRQRWWHHGLRLGTGVLLTIPWFFWGTLKQLRNADLKRFGVVKEAVAPWLRHLQDIAQTLGTHLLVGDWVTSLPPMSVVLAGFGVIALLLACSISLWQQGDRQVLCVVLLLGIIPLLLAATVDIVTNKFLVGFGWGRSMIFILPGCLLLLVLWLERASGRWRGPVATGLLLLYLGLSIGDFSLRQRWMFHQITDLIQQDPNTPTLMVMNSNAWGHVLRLAYYIPPTLPVMLLAQRTNKLIPALEKTLTTEASRYPRLLWLDSARPVWSPVSTPAEKQQIQQLLTKNQFQQTKTQQLSGTMILDEFTVNLFTRPAT